MNIDSDGAETLRSVAYKLGSSAAHKAALAELWHQSTPQMTHSAAEGSKIGVDLAAVTESARSVPYDREALAHDAAEQQASDLTPMWRRD